MSESTNQTLFPRFPSLSGKVILITGASSGIGAACARAFAVSGCRLVVLARRTDRLTQLTSELQALGAQDAIAVSADVRDAAAVRSAIASLPSALSAIDVVVHAAGLGRGRDKLFESNPAEWDEVLDTNVKGVLSVTQVVLPQMVQRDAGHIVHIGSVAGSQPYPGGAIYCASKAAIRMLNQCLKHDLLGTRVRVSTVDPGMVETEFSVVRFRGDTARAKAVYEGMTPMTADDVAEAVLFCVSRPAHVNISEITMLATDQASATTVHRR
ncbi:MAG: SDR family NAD(P)-dependent oxidoreductase [Myxococcales bacterium]|nr:SDR family NAD(P)-dependent oxidoreductase [Myxococcales bacterium]